MITDPSFATMMTVPCRKIGTEQAKIGVNGCMLREMSSTTSHVHEVAVLYTSVYEGVGGISPKISVK